MKYQVKLEVFEGPFDLLLSLITKQKIDIYDISLTTIIRDYLDYLNRIKRIDLEIASEFLIIAATLLKIKAGSLLPYDQEEEIGELSPFEARELLVAHLLEYKKFKNASEHLAKLMQSQYGFCRRKGEFEKHSPVRTDLLEGIAGGDLGFLLASLLVKSSKQNVVVSTEHILTPPVNLDDKIDFVVERLRLKSRETFRSLTKNYRTKIEVAVTFLALLELYRRRMVRLEQKENFGEIRIELTKKAEQLSVVEPYIKDFSKDTQHKQA